MLRKIILSLFLYVFAVNAQAKDKLLLVADYWCPYNCTPGSSYEGYLVELAKIAFEKEPVEIVYELRSWNQSVEDFNKGNVDGVFGTSDKDLDDPYLPAIAQAQGKVAAYTLSNKTWQYDGPSSLDNRSLGLTKSYSYPYEVRGYIYSNYLAQPEQFYFSVEPNPVEDNINKLQNAKTYSYIEDENVVNYYLKDQNIKNIRHAGFVHLTPENIYIAFSKTNQNAAKYAKLMTNAMVDLRTNGKLFELMQKYNIKNYTDVTFISRAQSTN